MKSGTLEGWKKETNDTKAGVPLAASYVTALLLNGYDSVVVDSQRKPDGKINLGIGISAKGNHSMGSAVPITRDGYFLTASHCVSEPGPHQLVTLTSKNGKDFWPMDIVKSSYRIVWRAPEAEKDLAVIYAPVRPMGKLTLASAEALREGTPVAAAGWSGFPDGAMLSATAAGNIYSVSKFKGDDGSVPVRRVVHSVPLSSGDSGGPLLNSDGKLMGINSSTEVVLSPLQVLSLLFRPDKVINIPLKRYQGVAVIPDRAKLWRIIEEDRMRNSQDANR